MKINELSHLDHGLTPEHLVWLCNRFANRTSFFIETVELSPDLPSLSCDMHGPIVGDAPVPEDDVTYAVRGDRSGKTRMVNRVSRPSRLLTVIAGPANGDPCVLYTAYAGPQAPREPWDSSLSAEEKTESEAFWSKHALTVSLSCVKNDAIESAALRIEECRRDEGAGLDASYLASEVRKLKVSP
jgi:hypothetical protein